MAAAALMYRKGYVKKGEPAVIETAPSRHHAAPHAHHRRDPGFDPNRDKGQIAEKIQHQGRRQPPRLPRRPGPH